MNQLGLVKFGEHKEFRGDCNVSDIKGIYLFVSFILGNKTVFCPKIKERS